jgi:hypothetical protein
VCLVHWWAIEYRSRWNRGSNRWLVATSRNAVTTLQDSEGRLIAAILTLSEHSATR